MSACKMGLSPDDSVVTLDGQVWDQENLFVVDTSILPSNTGESPQGKILATADEMCQRWVWFDKGDLTTSKINSFKTFKLQ